MKNKRQEKLLQLIEENVIVTQEDLQTLLVNSGFTVTQSTVSRDIKELRIIRHRTLMVYTVIFPQ